MARIMDETNVPLLIDEFRENLNLKLGAALVKDVRPDNSELLERASASTQGDSETCTPQRAHSEEASMDQYKKVDANENLQGTSSLKPGETPLASLTKSAPSEVLSITENLPNARSGQYYSVQLDQVLSELPHQLTLEDDGGTGMMLSRERQLSGTPTGAGAIQFSLSGSDEEGNQVLNLILKLALIPNSRELWKDNPADPTDLFAKPEKEVDRIAVGSGWHMAMGSLRGRSHAHRGGQRDDHGVIAQTSSGWNLLLVADGAGSCELSRQGSLLATTKARDSLTATLESDAGMQLEQAAISWWQEGDHSRMPQELLRSIQDTIITAVHQGHLAISEASKDSGHPLKAFSTTLLMAMQKVTDHGHLIITFGIGDGGIAVLSDKSHAVLMNNADSGQHAGQTRFLDAPLFHEGESLYQRVKVRIFDSLDAVILATDGVTDPKFNSDNDMREPASWWSFFSELAPALNAPMTESVVDPLLEYLNFFIERHHDDRTVAVLYRQEDNALGEPASSMGLNKPEAAPASSEIALKPENKGGMND